MVIVSVGLKVSAMVAQQQIRYGLTQVTLTNPDQFLCAFLKSWWSRLRSSVTDWWINLFKDMIQQGVLNPQNTLHRYYWVY